MSDAPKRANTKFKVGQVVAYRRFDEAPFRYGRIDSALGLFLEGDGTFKNGYRILDGVRFENCKGSQIRPLTARERGGSRG